MKHAKCIDCGKQGDGNTSWYAGRCLECRAYRKKQLVKKNPHECCICKREDVVLDKDRKCEACCNFIPPEHYKQEILGSMGVPNQLVTVDIKRGDHVATCSRCLGSGKIKKFNGLGAGGEVDGATTVKVDCPNCGGSGLIVDKEKHAAELAQRDTAATVLHEESFDRRIANVAEAERNGDKPLSQGLARGLLRMSFSQVLRSVEALISTEEFQLKDGIGERNLLAEDLSRMLNGIEKGSVNWTKVLILLLDHLQKSGLELDLGWLDTLVLEGSGEVGGGQLKERPPKGVL